MKDWLLDHLPESLLGSIAGLIGSITFRHNGSLWIEISRTTVDAPN